MVAFDIRETYDRLQRNEVLTKLKSKGWPMKSATTSSGLPEEQDPVRDSHWERILPEVGNEICSTGIRAWT